MRSLLLKAWGQAVQYVCRSLGKVRDLPTSQDFQPTNRVGNPTIYPSFIPNFYQHLSTTKMSISATVKINVLHTFHTTNNKNNKVIIPFNS